MTTPRRATDNIVPIAALITPILLAILAWFLAPVISLVPQIDKKMEVQTEKMSTLADRQVLLERKTDETNSKVAVKLESLEDKLDDVEDKVKDVERKVEAKK